MGRSKATNSPLKQRVARRLRDARLARDWSQEQLAAALDVSTQSVSRYECGALALSLDLLDRAARVLSIPVENLVGEGPAGLSPEEAELIEGWRVLGERGRQAVLETVRWGRDVLENRRVG